MPLVVGVSFKKAGKVYYFDPAGLDLHEGDHIIAETARGAEFGDIMMDPKEVSDAEIVLPLRKVIRKATEGDVRREESNRQKERQAFLTCQQKVQQHSLPMKLIDAEYCFDGSQVTFFFSAESRVDFRELVKDLAGSLRTKVQLHQVGVRDEAKLFGGLGPCGRVLCCTTFMSDFEPVSMKMAKEQSLFLNPLKFSGTCGKLMCCLKYEYPNYKEAKLRLPSAGMTVETPKGPGRVVEVNIIGETVAVDVEGTLIRYPASELGYQKPGCPAHGACSGCGAHDEEPPAAEETIEDAMIAEPVIGETIAVAYAVKTDAIVASAEPPAEDGQPAAAPVEGEAGADEDAPKRSGRRRHHRSRRKKE